MFLVWFYLLCILWLVDASSAVQLQPLHRRHWALPFPKNHQDCCGTDSPECSDDHDWNGNIQNHTTSDFTLQGNEQLLWTSPNDTQRPTVSFVVTPAPGEQIINMEKFADVVVAANCSETMTIQFKTARAFQVAQSSWEWVNDDINRIFILVGDPQICGSGSLREPWAVNHAAFEQRSRTIHLDATKKTWEEAAFSYTLDFGSLGKVLPKRQLGFDYAGESIFDLSTSWPTSLINVDKFPLLTFKANCANCGTQGSMILHGHIAGTLFEGITACELSVAPRGFKANLDLDIEFTGSWYSIKSGGIDSVIEESIDPPILLFPLAGGWDVPNVLTLGPTLNVTAGFELTSVDGEAKVSFGVSATIPDDSIVELDLVAKRIVNAHGWEPEFKTKPVTIDAKLTAEAIFYPLITVNVGLVVFPSVAFGSLPKHGVDLGVVIKEPITKIKASTGYKTDGFCPNTQQPGGVNLDVSFGASLNLESWMNVFGIQKNLLENLPVWEKDDVVEMDPICFPFGSPVSSSSSTIQIDSSTASSHSISTPSISSSSSIPPPITSRSSQPPSSPTILPPSRTCTSDCGWQWVASGAFGQFSANSWSLPTGSFQANSAGMLTLNTECVQPGELEFQPASIPAGSGYAWEDWPLGSDTADSCCLEYFASSTCERVLNGVVDQCIGSAYEPEGTVDQTVFEVKAFRVYGCRGLYTGGS